MNKEFRFVLKDRSIHDYSSSKTVFHAQKYDNVNNLYAITWENNGELGLNDYAGEHVERFIESGDWIVID